MKPLTRDEILQVVERPEGYRFIYNFCKTVEAGETPDKALKLVADAMWLILTEENHDRVYGLDLFADKLNLKWNPGEKPAGHSLEKHMEIISAVIEYQDKVSTGTNKIAASDRIASKYDRSGKTLRKWARIYSSDAESVRRFIAQLEARHGTK